MRVNVYVEEMTDCVELIEKTVNGETFTGLRIYLHLPVTQPDGRQIRGPFMHREGDDDSSAITFWGKRDTLLAFEKAIALLKQHNSTDV